MGVNEINGLIDRDACLEGCCSTIELHPRRILQGALADGAELIPFMAIPDGEVNAEPEPV
jgi:DNA repair protein RadC